MDIAAMNKKKEKSKVDKHHLPHALQRKEEGKK